MSESVQDCSRAIFATLDTGLILLDREKRVILWNAWFSAMSGVPSEVAAGKRLEEIFHLENSPRLRSAIASAFESGVSSLLTHSLHPSLFPLKTRAGRKLVHDVMIGTVGEKTGTRCLIQVVDVTVSTERERILRERQNARYDAVVTSAPDAIVTLDEAGTIQLANPAAQSQFGYRSGELVGRSADVLFPDQQDWSEMLAAVVAGRPVQSPIDLVGRRKDGNVSHLEVSLTRWRSDARVFVTAILRDVTERHAAEAARKLAAETLAHLNATLEERVAERTKRLLEAERRCAKAQKWKLWAS